MFDQSQLTVKPGEVIRLTFRNPDAVPHNWALVQKGSLQEIGEQCNQLIADPAGSAINWLHCSPIS